MHALNATLMSSFRVPHARRKGVYSSVKRCRYESAQTCLCGSLCSSYVEYFRTHFCIASESLVHISDHTSAENEYACHKKRRYIVLKR